MDRITKSVSKLSNTTLPNLRDTITKRISTKALQMVTTNRHPRLSFSQLPSSRYRNLRSRINIRANCFRSVAIQNLNRIHLAGECPLILCYFSINELTFSAALVKDNLIYCEIDTIKVHYITLTAWSMQSDYRIPSKLRHGSR